MMRNLYNRIQKASQAVHGPESAPVKVGSYSGISFDDPSLVGIRENLMSHWYNPAQGIEKFLGMLSLSHVHPCTWCFNGMNAGGPYLPRQVFENFNNYFFINKESQKDINPPVGGRPVVLNSSFMSQYWVPGREAQTFGAIKSTREIGVTTKGRGQLVRFLAANEFSKITTSIGSLALNWTCAHVGNKNECTHVTNGTGTHCLHGCGGTRPGRLFDTVT
eukprot:m.51824 g.51824  ORF g.51824 m.51824 type:complete len:219 (-) comp9073_c0_seq1:4802-5458(-)